MILVGSVTAGSLIASAQTLSQADEIHTPNAPLAPPGGASQVSLHRSGEEGRERPMIQFPFLRYDEDWSFLRDRSKRADFWDPIKYIPIGKDGSIYLSLGGESRQVYEYYHNQYWGAGPQDSNGWILQRYMAHADLHIGPQFRIFSQVQAALENGRNGGARPYDKDKLDLHQAFFDVKLPKGKSSLTVRLGRQELFYGSGRLIEAREGPNARVSFDGAKILARLGPWQVDSFWTRPTIQKPGFFDDSPDSKQMFWGMYATRGLVRQTALDLYYLGLNQKLAVFEKGSAQQVRQTVGGRWSGSHGAIDFDDEAVGQLGTFGHGSIRAWGVAIEHGYTFRGSLGVPRISIRSDIASGDDDPRSRNLGTFYPLFAKGKYFGEADLNGPSNTFDLQPALALHVFSRTTFSFDYGAFWRQSTHDGLYGFSGNLERPGQLTSSRFIGQQAEVDLDHVVNAHLVLRAVYQHFFAGDFLRHTPPGRDGNYAAGWFDYHF